MMRMPQRQRGLTMVELLVALALSTVIALAAVAALVVSRRGFTSVDAASELRDNGRFAASMLQRITAQAGYLDWQFAMVNRLPQDLADPPPSVMGFNNAKIVSSTTPIDDINPTNAAAASNNNRSGNCNTAAAAGCSDILVVRYQPQGIPGAAPTGSPAVTPSDGTMIDCSGRPVIGAPTIRDEQGISILHVEEHRGEPTLMCTAGARRMFNNVLTYFWEQPIPVVSNVENFQVLYGTDGVSPGLAPTAATDSVPDRYLRADQMTVPANPIATNQNWRRVRSVRIGLVLRGPVGSQQESDSSTIFPLGLGKESSTGTDGHAMSSANDPGTRYSPPADNRLRQTLTFTVYLHNDLGLCGGKACTVQ
jgi:type IV pilus assembly protein PilW